MSVNGPISVWRCVTNYVPGMDLGEPDEIMPAPSFLEKGRKRPTIVSPNGKRKNGGGARKKFKLSKEEYLSLRNSGLTRQEIADQVGVNIDTLKHYLTGWKIGKKNDELAAMEQFESNLREKDAV